MSSTPRLAVGQKVELNDERVGTVRYVGTVHFQTGEWIGVELTEDSGKNNGTVKGQRYFDCATDYGIFCRPSGIGRIIEDVKPRQAKAAGNGAALKPRPSSVDRTATTITAPQRQTLTQGATTKRVSGITHSQGTPTPAPRIASGIRSPLKSPTKQLGTNGASSASTSRTNTPPVAGRRPATTTAASKSRPSLAPPATTLGDRRTSTLSAGPAIRTTKPPTTTRSGLSRPSIGSTVVPRAAAKPGTKDRLSSTTEESTTNDDGSEIASTRESVASSTASLKDTDVAEEEEGDKTITSFAPPPMPPIPPEPAERTTRPRRPSSPAAASIHSQRTIRSTAQTNRQIEELEAKVRLLDRKRVEDREVKQKLEKAEHERDSFKNIIEKLQTKYKPQSQEVERLKKKVTEYESQQSSIDDIRAQHEMDLESALLDREVAEEMAEALKADLEAIRSRNEELELEFELMKEENSELGKEMTAEERSNTGWLNLQKANERLKEALLSLRDMTRDSEAELKEQIEALEERIKDHDIVLSQYEETKDTLLRSQADVEDLRQSLEVAQGEQEMLERLSDENMGLKDKISDLHGVIEDLENLKEINDELDINHVETEKQMQEEIEFKDSLLLDRERTAKEQQAALDEADRNINLFRALVTQLQSEIQDMQASKQISESEAAELSNKSKAMLDLNKQLQSSVAKTQVKTIDLGLRRLDAEQASEHLAIVQLFLPDSFQAERDSVLALLRFKRIAFKADLVQTFLKERIASFGSRGEEEEVFAACEALHQLTWIANMSDRLINSISSCSADAFTNFGGALYELEVVERTMNDYVDSLRQNDLKEGDMPIRLSRNIEVMTHLSSLHLRNGLAEHADDLAMRTSLLQSRLDSVTSGLTVTRSMMEKYLPTSSEEEEYEDENVSDAALILNRIKSIIEQARNSKVIAGRTHRGLVELQTRQLTLEPSFRDDFEKVESVSVEITAYVCQTGAALKDLFGEEGHSEPHAPSEVSDILSRFATSVLSAASEAGPYATLNSRLRDLTTLLGELSALPTDLDNTVEFERAPAPWVARAEEVKKAKETTMDMEAELLRSQEHVRERDGLIRQKETELNEQSIRIEMLEARMKDASKRSARIAELERAVRDAKDRESKAKAELARAQEDAQRDVSRVHEELSRLSEERKKGGVLRDIDGNAMGSNAKMILRRQEYRIASLEGAIRHLKDENHKLRIPAADGPRSNSWQTDWLAAPMIMPKKIHEQQSRQRDGERVLESMLALAVRAPSIDLSKMPENKLAWRPAKQGSRWKVESKNEEWADWKAWREEIVGRKASTRQGLSAEGKDPGLKPLRNGVSAV